MGYVRARTARCSHARCSDLPNQISYLGTLGVPSRSCAGDKSRSLARDGRDCRWAAVPWRRCAGRISDGRRTARIVAERVKTVGARSGLDSHSYAAHSLRSGFATSAARRTNPRRRSCAKGAGRAFSSRAGTSARARAGAITPVQASDCSTHSGRSRRIQK